MRIVITRWGLDSYMDFLQQGLLTREVYFTELRPDIIRLRNMKTDPKFKSDKFWGPAVDMRGKDIPDGFKMKWHNVGGGRIAQLRLCVALIGGDAFLCHAYSKTSAHEDKRMAARLKSKITQIRNGQPDVERGEL